MKMGDVQVSETYKVKVHVYCHKQAFNRTVLYKQQIQTKAIGEHGHLPIVSERGKYGIIICCVFR